jgi:Pentapeptide repeats (8 copies)
MLHSAKLQGAYLAEAQLQGATLTNARLQGANLAQAQLQGANLVFARLQGANLAQAQLQGADLAQAQLQGADLDGTKLQGSSLVGTQLHGADLSSADLEFTELEGTFVFRTDHATADLSTAAIRSVRADQVRPGTLSTKVDQLNDADVDDWITSAMQFDKSDKIKKRFERLKLNPGFQTAAQDAADEAKWAELMKGSVASDPDGAHHRERLAAFLGDLACGSDGAPYVARGLIWNNRLTALRDQLAAVRARMEEGRKNPEKCPGVAGFIDKDWRKLEAIKSD